MRVHPGSRTRHVGILAVLALIVCFIAGVESERIIQGLILIIIGAGLLVMFLRWWAG